MDNPEIDSPEIVAPETVVPKSVVPETVVPESDPDTHRFECRSCGFVYDPEEGVKNSASR